MVSSTTMMKEMKVKPTQPLQWITLPNQQKTSNMKTKQIILCSLMIITACFAVLIFAPTVMAKDEKSTLNAMETKFVQETAASGMAVVKMADLAVKKSQNKDIKAFAMMLSKDHGKANEDLKMLATKKGVTLSGTLDPMLKETWQKLEASEGMVFDKLLISEIVKCHEKDITSFKKISMDGQDPDLKMLVDTMLPVLVTHGEKAKELKAE